MPAVPRRQDDLLSGLYIARHGENGPKDKCLQDSGNVSHHVTIAKLMAANVKAPRWRGRPNTGLYVP
jgi:hypothetical protein